MNKESYQWRYTSFGHSSHLIAEGRLVAICGRSPSWYAKWHGSENDERERCAALPKCRDCLKKYAHDVG